MLLSCSSPSQLLQRTHRKHLFLSSREKQRSREERYDMTNPDRDCVTKRGLAGSKLDASVLLLAFFSLVLPWTVDSGHASPRTRE